MLYVYNTYNIYGVRALYMYVCMACQTNATVKIFAINITDNQQT